MSDEVAKLRGDVARLRKILDIVLPCVERDAAATEDHHARKVIESVARAIRKELGSPNALCRKEHSYIVASVRFSTRCVLPSGHNGSCRGRAEIEVAESARSEGA